MTNTSSTSQPLLSPTLVIGASLGAAAYYFLGGTHYFVGSFATFVGDPISGDTLRLLLAGIVGATPSLGGLLKDVLNAVLVALGLNSKPQLDRVEALLASLETAIKDARAVLADVAKTLNAKAAPASGETRPPAEPAPAAPIQQP